MQLYTNKEYSLIKNTLSPDVLSAIRKQLLDQPLSDTEKNYAKITPEIEAIFRKTLNLDFNADIELQQLVNPYSGIDYTKDAEDVTIQLLARQRAISYMNAKLSGKKDKLDSMVVDDSLSDRENAINGKARQTAIDTIQLAINKLDFISKQEDESWEQLQERLQKDSAK
jgi:hypothetical protein